MPKKRAFTITELLIVIVILAALAAILFPVFSAATIAAKAEASKEYLKQQYITVELYGEDNEWRLPSWQVIQADTRMHASCSPLDDYWKTPCWYRPSPMVGSYGYAPAMNSQLLQPVIYFADPRPFLADIFSAHYKVGEFSGDYFPDKQACADAWTCDFPDRIWFMYTDGSLKVQKNPMPVSPLVQSRPPTQQFSWPAAFIRQMNLDKPSGT